MHLRKEDKRRREGWIILLYNNQPKFAYTCGEGIDVGFGNDEMTDKDNVQQGGYGQPTATRTMDNGK